MFKTSPSPFPQTSHKTIHWIVLLGRVIGEGRSVICSIYPFTLLVMVNPSSLPSSQGGGTRRSPVIDT
nr:MAG TPA: hypothetical protein [Caudoviricetes sp.]